MFFKAYDEFLQIKSAGKHVLHHAQDRLRILGGNHVNKVL